MRDSFDQRLSTQSIGGGFESAVYEPSVDERPENDVAPGELKNVAETGTTTDIITHNEAIAGLGDCVVRMSSGEIMESWRNEQRAPIDQIHW